MIVYPEWPKLLKSCETNSKRRNQVQGFKYSNVNAGPSYLELVTDDTPTDWDITFVFNRDQARVFRQWLNATGFYRKPTWFKFPIQIEEGVTEQIVRFLDRPQCTSQDNNVFTYSTTIRTRKEASEDDLYPDSILAMGELNPCDGIDKGGELLDTAINVSWPKVNCNG